MNEREKARMRRNYVSNMYPGIGWKIKVAEYGDDRILAIYLRMTRDDQKPIPEKPEKPEPDIQKDPEEKKPPDDDQLELF